MTTATENLSRTVHLPTGHDAPASHAKTARATPARKGLMLTDVTAGETVRIIRLGQLDNGCRKRFAELGLAEGMKVTVASTGDTLMLIIGGSRMGVASRCAEGIQVLRLPG